MMARFQKDMGDSVGSFGGHELVAERVPTGLFEFDLATGGGFPRGMCSIVYGPESSNKTNQLLLAIKMNQWLRPKETNVYIAIEPFDKPWAKKLGVDVDKLAVLYPSYAEQAVDIAEGFLNAEDCGVVGVDSLAAMITTAEAEKSADGNTPGGPGLVIGKLVRKTALALREAEKAGRSPTLIYINQIRHKIGVMYGSPESMPGGFAPLFQAQLRVRVHGKPVTDTKIHDTIPVLREVTFMVKKNKVPIIADNGMYKMVTYPHSGLQLGETDDFSTIAAYLEKFGAWEKLKKGYSILGETYLTQDAFKTRLYGDKAFGIDVRQGIILRALADHEEKLVVEEATSIDADGVVAE
jgi:recombination protein RecA